MKMKNVFALIALTVATVFTVNIARAANEALPIRVKYSTTNVSTSAYTQLVASTVKGLSGYSVLNTGSAPIKIAFGASAAEVDQTIHNASYSTGAVYYPVNAGYGTRISVISLDQTNSTGELQVNLIYN